jgi:uncharacterized protein
MLMEFLNDYIRQFVQTKHFMKKVILIIAVLFSTQMNAQTTVTIPDPVRKIEVTGSAEMEVVPDEVFVSITLQEYRKENKSKVSIDEISRTFLAACEKAGISKDRIEVQNMSGFDQSEWYWRKRKKEQPDLMQSTSYVIKFSSPAEMDKLANLLDDQSTQNVYVMKSSNSKEKEYRKQLKTEALKNARAKAAYMLEGIEAKVDEVLFVRELEAGNMVYPMYKNAMMMANQEMDAGSANEGLNFKKIKYLYQVEAHFRIK